MAGRSASSFRETLDAHVSLTDSEYRALAARCFAAPMRMTEFRRGFRSISLAPPEVFEV
jgi:hypothetical protein